MKCNILSVSHTQSHTSSSFRACQTASQRSCSYAPMATTGHKAISAEELEVATVFVLQCALAAHPWQKCNKLFLHKILKKKKNKKNKEGTHGCTRLGRVEEGGGGVASGKTTAEATEKCI